MHRVGHVITGIGFASLLALLAGCPTNTEQAEAPKPLKPNVSPTGPDKPPREFVSGEPVAETPPGEVQPGATEAERVPGTAEPAHPAAPAETPAPGRPGTAGELPPAETPIWQPVVAMSQAHRDTCKVYVGNELPPLKVESLTGAAVDTAELLNEAFTSGHQLAVVVFWQADHVYGREQYERITEELIEPFGDAGVKVVAIHVGGNAAQVNEVPFQPAEPAASLIDPNQSAFELVAADKLPRTYLIDAEGTIQWLDIEYSRGTRRELRNAILYHRTRLADGAE